MADLRNALPATIRTARLTMQQPALADLDAMVALLANWNVTRWTASVPYPYAREDGIAFIETIATSPEQRPYAVHADGALIGTVGLIFVRATPELGYWIGEPYWGLGYAAEASAALLAETARLAPGVPVRARVLADNPRSLRVLEKLGFDVVEHTLSTVERHLGQPLVILERRGRRDEL